jgi:hypothetical protein
MKEVVSGSLYRETEFERYAFPAAARSSTAATLVYLTWCRRRLNFTAALVR